jgi:uncharacterized repeat protein (TIGR01451 family)
LNFTSSTAFDGNVVLAGGLTPDNVLFNFVGGSNLTGGPPLSFNNGNSSDGSSLDQGIFLDPNGRISANPSNILGRLFGGDTANFQFNGGSNITAPGTGAAPTVTTTPNPTTITLGAGTPPVLKDSATLTGANSPIGAITFLLFFNGAPIPVHTETVPVTGNGTFTTPAGFTLPGTGAVAGTYEWAAFYTGDTRNNTFADFNTATEQVTVIAATPTLTTTPSATTIRLGATTPPILTDSATLTGGYNPTGTITFTLVAPDGTTVDTETGAVNGNNIYTTPTGFTLPTTGAVTGTYQWNATYNGDANDNTASDVGSTTEQVMVKKAIPTLITTPSTTTIRLGATTPPILTDSATLDGGYHPGGTISFTLFHNGGTTPVDTETVTVNGNNTYTTPTGFTLPTTGTVIGTYQWNATYNGDANDHTASDINSTTEQVAVKKAIPSLTTTPNLTSITLGTNSVTLTDTATLTGGYNPTGTITFKLFHNGGTTPVFTRSVAVSGNGPVTSPGVTLPGTGTVTGTYQWDATYNGDANNHTASDINDPSEAVTVTPASPTIATQPNPTTVTLGTTAVTLTDSATLSGGYHPTGAITFTLIAPSGATVNTQKFKVNGNGTYTTTGVTLPTTGRVAGTYQWNATYSGNANNDSASDINDASERVTVRPASPTLTTMPKPTTVTLGTTGETLRDGARLRGGYHPTGTITFTLIAPGGATVDTETVNVNGNGGYATPKGFTLPATGTVAGTYQWNATYSGNRNNNAVSDISSLSEQVQVTPASPSITTITVPLVGLLGMTLQDVADLTGGFHPTGTITFSLYAPGVDPTTGTAIHTETVTVNGDGTYPTTVGFVSNATGIWHWVATFNGDSNNTSVSTGPLDEPVIVESEPPVITGRTDLALTKVVTPTQVAVGANVTYTETVHDNGPGTATDVVVADPLPAGLTFVSATPSQGTYDPQTGLWTVGTLAVGASAVLQVTARVETEGPVVNEAGAAGFEFDPDLSNNVDSASLVSLSTKRSLLGSALSGSAQPAPPTQPLPSLATLQSDIVFVEALYQVALGRSPQPAELAHWMHLLLLGTPRSVIASMV